MADSFDSQNWNEEFPADAPDSGRPRAALCQWPHQRLVALIAHDLQPVLGIARDQSVINGDDIDQLVERIDATRRDPCEHTDLWPPWSQW